MQPKVVSLSHIFIIFFSQIQLPRHIALPLIAQHRRTLREISLEADLPSERPAVSVKNTLFMEN